MSVAALEGQGNSAWGTGEVKFADCNLGVEGEEKKLTSVLLTIQPGSKSIVSEALWGNNGTATFC